MTTGYCPYCNSPMIDSIGCSNLTCPNQKGKDQKFRCPMCDAKFMEFESLKYHYAEEHPEAVVAKRHSVNYRFNALNWEFLKMLAIIASYSDQKYGKWDNYTESRLTGEKSPLNHLIEHYRQYLAGEPHDYFGDATWHLAAIAYNAMMEFYYHTQFGHLVSPLGIHQKEPPRATNSADRDSSTSSE